MNSTAFPPELAPSAEPPPDGDVLTVTLPRQDAALSLSDRLSLRIGLWLLLRAQRDEAAPRRPASPRLIDSPAEQRLDHEQSLTLATHRLLCQLR